MSDRQPRILVVDDVADWRYSVRCMLEDEGYDVLTAQFTYEALHIIDTEKIDVAILDIRLDDMEEDNKDGLWLAHAIRQKKTHIVIILYTGFGTDETLMEAMKPRKGGRLANDYILKKDVNNSLIPSVKRALEY